MKAFVFLLAKQKTTTDADTAERNRTMTPDHQPTSMEATVRAHRLMADAYKDVVSMRTITSSLLSNQHRKRKHMSKNPQIVASDNEEYRYLHDKIVESNQLVKFAREKAELVQWIIDNDCARGKLPKARTELDLMKGKLDELRAMGEELSTGKKDFEGPESSPSLKAMRYNLLSHVNRSLQGLEDGYNELDRCLTANLK